MNKAIKISLYVVGVIVLVAIVLGVIASVMLYQGLQT